MDKTEWPTEKRIAQLRESGELPYSTFGSRCMTASVVLLLLGIFAAEWGSDLQSILLSSLSTSDPRPVTYAFVLLSKLGTILLILGGAIAVGIVFLGLLQNRFFFRLSQLSPQFERLNPFRAIPTQRIMTQLVLSLLLLICAVGIGGISARFGFSFVLGLLNRGQAEWPTLLSDCAGWFFVGTAFLLVVIAAVGIGVRRYLFLRAHRMTRLEVDSESRA